MKSYKEINKDQNAFAREFRKTSPDILNGFMAMHKAAMEEGALSTKVKELMALSIGIAARCDGCIASHAKASLRAGATREELVETINVAIMMGGGPAVIYGTQALSAVDEFLS
ncbi:carboxymuconolactone decarboxylase family protein [Marinomonas sp. IMCC 4694]|uniref:carboxymuconolactone decarboxylase family protein n=1 Tax=Marinomonas sp. IMCC 4694 TaxID=2605432 RepID=UPI0011E88BCB|nr:carboxymuconolactone decarboxylase family protein [Marinomonas sp. IMCC 4694]TYL47554.1 carboxymuconolactone decarboxylase family protein [Marinomonas sp. IMCC 4694]